MTTPNDLSDKALAVLAFAIYHQLNSGDVVSGIAARDGEGHQASQDALSELKSLDLITQNDSKVHFTAAGQLMIEQIIERMRGSW